MQDKGKDGKKRSRRYSERERAEALSVVKAEGGVVARAARITGIPAATLMEWVKGRIPEPVVKLRVETDISLFNRFGSIANKLGGLMEADIDESLNGGKKIPLEKMALVIGILVDKMEKLKKMEGGADDSEDEPPAPVSDEERERVTKELLEKGRARLALVSGDR